jgi:hypothetical protein
MNDQLNTTVIAIDQSKETTASTIPKDIQSLRQTEEEANKGLSITVTNINDDKDNTIQASSQDNQNLTHQIDADEGTQAAHTDRAEEISGYEAKCTLSDKDDEDDEITLAKKVIRS